MITAVFGAVSILVIVCMSRAAYISCSFSGICDACADSRTSKSEKNKSEKRKSEEKKTATNRSNNNSAEVRECLAVARTRSTRQYVTLREAEQGCRFASVSLRVGLKCSNHPKLLSFRSAPKACGEPAVPC